MQRYFLLSIDFIVPIKICIMPHRYAMNVVNVFVPPNAGTSAIGTVTPPAPRPSCHKPNNFTRAVQPYFDANQTIVCMKVLHFSSLTHRCTYIDLLVLKPWILAVCGPSRILCNAQTEVMVAGALHRSSWSGSEAPACIHNRPQAKDLVYLLSAAS